MVRIPSDRDPTRPGEMLLQELLLPLGMTQRDLATAIHVPFQRVNEIVRGRGGVTPSTASGLSKFFGTSYDFWINLQLRWDPYHTQLAETERIESVRPHDLVNVPQVLARTRIKQHRFSVALRVFAKTIWISRIEHPPRDDESR